MVINNTIAGDFNEVYDQLRVKASICNEVTYIQMKEFSNLDTIHHYHIQVHVLIHIHTHLYWYL